MTSFSPSVLQFVPGSCCNFPSMPCRAKCRLFAHPQHLDVLGQRPQGVCVRRANAPLFLHHPSLGTYSRMRNESLELLVVAYQQSSESMASLRPCRPEHVSLDPSVTRSELKRKVTRFEHDARPLSTLAHN